MKPMKRRDLIAGAILPSGETASDSLYIPKPQRVEDLALLHDFLDEFAFGDLVTVTPELRITHIPVLLQRSAGAYGTLLGHIARANPQIQAIQESQSAVVVFRGPHAYISPSWYAKSETVPTWNFAAVHAGGKLKPVSDKAPLRDILARLIQKFEGRYGQGTYEFDKLPDSYVDSMMKGILGFEMRIETLEGKFKLGQDRSEADRSGILRGLEKSKGERGMVEFTRVMYEKLPVK